MVTAAKLLTFSSVLLCVALPGYSEPCARAASGGVAAGAARGARAEAERLRSEELERLSRVDGALGRVAAELEGERLQIVERWEATLAWQRRLREAKERAQGPLDALYDELLGSLSAARAELGAVLAGKTEATLPALGSEPLEGVAQELDLTSVRAERERLRAESTRLAALQRELREERAAQLAQQVSALNRERLALLDYLSESKLQATLGFTRAGLEQASSELQHLLLLERYQAAIARDWLQRTSGSRPSGLSAQLLTTLCIWVAAFGLFIAWRRRAPALFEAWRARLRETEPQLGLADPGPRQRAVELLARVHQLLEWLVLCYFLPAFLPEALLLRLLRTVLLWVLGGALVVRSIDVLAQRSQADDADDALRLRSLRLVGIVVIAFGLVLSITARGVGRGTIYSWALHGCWLAALPVLLILVRWWRGSVFARLQAQPQTTGFEAWLLRHQLGWRSSFCALAGCVYLFMAGALRALRRWLMGFDITRRALAHSFQRELRRLAADRSAREASFQPLSAALCERLGPTTPSEEHIETELDAALARVAERISTGRGGVLALVAERGMGKTHALGRLRRLAHGSPIELRLGVSPLDELLARLRAELGLPSANLERAAASLERTGPAPVLLLDDAQRLIQPLIGGLSSFDDLMSVARAHSQHVSWVFAFSDCVWPFLTRARGVYPLFDEVIRLPGWREPEIAALLEARSRAAGIAPSFEHLLEGDPARAGGVERARALRARAQSYHRLIWDYAGGNPAVALDVWRRALGADSSGQIFVRLFPALSTSELERLPDPAVFVLRAVLQLAPAAPREIARATLLSAAEVADALRYAASHGYLDKQRERYQVNWTWLRPISRLLQRRHLLVTS